MKSTTYNIAHKDRIAYELQAAGLSRYAMSRPEPRHLHMLIHPDEHIEAAICGAFGSGTGMLVATDRRVIFTNRKPLSSLYDEFTYDVVSGIAVSRIGMLLDVILHTHVGNFRIHTIPNAAHRQFVSHIEQRRIEQPRQLGSAGDAKTQPA